MNSVEQFFEAEKLATVYGPSQILMNIGIAFILGMIISHVYKLTHRGLSYSQSFMLTLVFVAVIVSIVMMVIGNSLARAFALVGALSIIRFRTVVKDTKDTAYVFLSLAAGMASGTGSYFLAVTGVAFMSAIAIMLHSVNYGSLYKSEFILRFRVRGGEPQPAYIDSINQFAKSSQLLHLEPSGDRETRKLTFDVVMKKDVDPSGLSEQLANIDGISEVVLVASKHDADY